MNTKTENLPPSPSPEDREVGAAESGVTAPHKKAYVEPEVSFPTDVLEATTFFQLADSGSTT